VAEPALRVRLAQRAPIPLAVEFECAAGELVALVGPSGSGKTTVLRCIAGLVRARDGVVRCNGDVWQDASRFVAPQSRHVGMVFQNFALFPHLSARDNVEAALPPMPASKRRSRALELLELVHLGGLEERPPRALSGGQQQRVAVARALARDPQVLLLDEPFSAVDQVTRRRLQRELAQLRRRLRMPIVLVTHDLEEAAMLADRMIVVHVGETLQSGPPFELLAKPRDVQVARLVDFRNLFQGEIAAHHPEAGHSLVRWLGYTLETPFRPEFDVGAPICWGILPAHCILHRRDRPSRGERENPVAGVICEFVPLGENAAVTMQVDGRADSELQLSIPWHGGMAWPPGRGSAFRCCGTASI
jgi:molybdate transport system ATP-binding protein